MTKYKILEWLYLKIEKELKAEHLRIHHNDMKCSNCNEWFSISGVKYNHSNVYDENKEFFICECGQCGNTSNWSPNIAPCLIRVDDNGNPITDK